MQTQIKKPKQATEKTRTMSSQVKTSNLPTAQVVEEVAPSQNGLQVNLEPSQTRGAVYNREMDGEGGKHSTSVSMLFLKKVPHSHAGEKWVVPKNVYSVSFLGGHVIDFSNAEFVESECHIHAGALFGKSIIIVPPGVRVESKGIGLLGKFKVNNTENFVAGAPTIYVHGSATFGRVVVNVNNSVPPVRVQ